MFRLEVAAPPPVAAELPEGTMDQGRTKRADRGSAKVASVPGTTLKSDGPSDTNRRDLLEAVENEAMTSTKEIIARGAPWRASSPTWPQHLGSQRYRCRPHRFTANNCHMPSATTLGADAAGTSSRQARRLGEVGRHGGE